MADSSSREPPSEDDPFGAAEGIDSRLEEQFLRAQRLSALSQVASGIAHDLRNVLATIQSTAYLLELRAPAGITERVDEIGEAVARGAALTRQLADFSRPKPHEDEPHDLNVLLLQMAPVLVRLVPDHVNLSYEPTLDSGATGCAPHVVEQVLMCLVDNACDAMPDGGAIEVCVGAEAEPAREVSPRGRLTIAVEDTGAGVAPGLEAQIFEPYFTTKPGHSGLGLPVARSVLRRIGGDLRHEPSASSRSRFLILLPRA